MQLWSNKYLLYGAQLLYHVLRELLPLLMVHDHPGPHFPLPGFLHHHLNTVQGLEELVVILRPPLGRIIHKLFPNSSWTTSRGERRRGWSSFKCKPWSMAMWVIATLNDSLICTYCMESLLSIQTLAKFKFLLCLDKRFFFLNIF